MNINKTLQQKVNDLLSQISVGNKVRFGSTSQKGTKKKAAIKRGQSELAHFAEREQLRIIFKAVMQGRTDYENMLLMTIGIKKYQI